MAQAEGVGNRVAVYKCSFEDTPQLSVRLHENEFQGGDFEKAAKRLAVVVDGHGCVLQRIENESPAKEAAKPAVVPGEIYVPSTSTYSLGQAERGSGVRLPTSHQVWCSGSRCRGR